VERFYRRNTRTVKIGTVVIGGSNPIAVQSMTKTPTVDTAATLAQIKRLQEAGCEIVRVAVPNQAAVRALERICAESRLPVVADIHFREELAVAAIKAGCAKVRVNPANLSENGFLRVVDFAGERGIPLRIGLNSGSLPPERLQRSGGEPAEALVALGERFVSAAQERGFADIVLSFKSSDPLTTLRAYRHAAEIFPYPLHLGLTEAGDPEYGFVKSAAVLGGLLLEGIGDTLRISLVGDPAREVEAAYRLLKATGRRVLEPEIIACPGCARSEIDLPQLVGIVKEATAGMSSPIKIAVCGCVVNGPGEARQADLGVTAAKGQAIIFRRGKVIRKVEKKDLASALREEIARLQVP